ARHFRQLVALILGIVQPKGDNLVHSLERRLIFEKKRVPVEMEKHSVRSVHVSPDGKPIAAAVADGWIESLGEFRFGRDERGAMERLVQVADQMEKPGKIDRLLLVSVRRLKSLESVLQCRQEMSRLALVVKFRREDRLADGSPIKLVSLFGMNERQVDEVPVRSVEFPPAHCPP